MESTTRPDRIKAGAEDHCTSAQQQLISDLLVELIAAGDTEEALLEDINYYIEDYSWISLAPTTSLADLIAAASPRYGSLSRTDASALITTLQERKAW